MKTVVSVIGKDAVGIISKVSAVCAECNANIVDITQSVLQDMFVMVMLTEINELNCSFSQFSEKMTAIGYEKSLDIRVMHEDINAGILSRKAHSLCKFCIINSKTLKRHEHDHRKIIVKNGLADILDIRPVL